MAGSVSDEAFARAVQLAGIVSFERIEEARRLQEEAQRNGQGTTLADALVRIGAITQEQRQNLERKVQAEQQTGGLRQLGPYKLLKKLGEGGMGAVYLADDTAVGRKVAVKVLPKKYSEEREFLTRFRREAQATGKLNHVNIVIAYNVGEDAGTHYYAMEYCEGDTLDRILKRDKVIPWDAAVGAVLQVARGLKHAHDHGIIHRDIKPANIFICVPLVPHSAGLRAEDQQSSKMLSEGFVAKILDLGLSKNISGDEQSFYTQTGAIVGTPHYISPEQARGDKSIDGRTDIYSLGATLYHLLTGETPFQGSTALAILNKHLTEELPNPQDISPDIPDGVVQVIAKMMAKDVADRYANCAELIADLDEVAQGKMPDSQALDVGKSSVAVARRVPQSAGLRKPQFGKLRNEPRGTRQQEPVGERRKDGRRAADAVELVPLEPAPNRKPWYIACGALGVGLLVFVLALVFGGKSETPSSKGEGTVSGPSSVVSGGKTPPAGVQPVTSNLKPETALPKEVVLDLGGGVKMEFVLIPAGEFMMGEKGVAEPVHPVKITKPFYLGKYEVTQAQYEKVMGANPSRWKGADLPVEQVSWDDAQKFCERTAGVSPASPGAGGTPAVRTIRLPTEAQWEYACRAGTTTEYNTGQGEAALEKAGWFNKNSGGKTNPVGKKAPNAWGLYDMHGNVWEWCEDRWGDKYYAETVSADPPGPATGNDRVLRGGSWLYNPGVCRSAHRFRYNPGYRYHDFGFRVRLDLPTGGVPVAVQPETTNLKPETALPKEVVLDLAPGVKMELVLVPPGEFKMGADDADARPEQKPVHKVKLSKPYYIGKYDVTVAQFRAFADAMKFRTEAEEQNKGWTVKDGKWQEVSGVHWRNPGFKQEDNHPAVVITWNDTQAFCKWATTVAGRTVRLPTEAEWEYAARGPQSPKYPWGDKWEGTMANVADASLRRAGFDMRWGETKEDDGYPFTSPGGAYKNASWCGAFDMAGNIGQWCQDYFNDKYYSESPAVDPQGPADGVDRVTRGFAWFNEPSFCRSARRGWFGPEGRAASNGFRVVLEPAKAP